MSSTELPVINRPLDNTALSALMTCEREYYIGMHLHRRGISGTSASLAFGGVVHVILDTHYKTGGLEALVELRARNWWAKHGHADEGDHRTLERALLDYKRYRKHWGNTPQEEQGRTIGFPDAPMVEIAFDITDQSCGLQWAGRIDRIIELGGLHYVEDHKTTSRLDANYYRGFDLSNQMMGYTWAGRRIAPVLNIVGVRLNIIHILKEKTNFERQLFTFTKEQLQEWQENTLGWVGDLRQAMSRWPTEQQLREGASWPRAHYGDNGCSRKYGMCQYHRLCSVAPPFRWRALEEIAINPWNPLEVEE